MNVTDISTKYVTSMLDNSVASAAVANARRAASEVNSADKKNDEELMNACKNFEEYFIEQILKLTGIPVRWRLLRNRCSAIMRTVWQGKLLRRLRIVVDMDWHSLCMSRCTGKHLPWTRSGREKLKRLPQRLLPRAARFRRRPRQRKFK